MPRLLPDPTLPLHWLHLLRPPLLSAPLVTLTSPPPRLPRSTFSIRQGLPLRSLQQYQEDRIFAAGHFREVVLIIIIIIFIIKIEGGLTGGVIVGYV